MFYIKKSIYKNASIGLICTLIAACNNVGNSSDNSTSNNTLSTTSSTTNSLTNNISSIGQTGTPGYSYGVPVICFQDGNGTFTQEMAYGTTITNISQYSGNDYYAGASVRMSGCDTSIDPYLGYIGFNISPTSSSVTLGSYQPSAGIHMSFNPSIANNVMSGDISFTPIDNNLTDSGLIPTNITRKLPYIGVNLSGMEFGNILNATTIPNLSATDASTAYSDLASTKSLVSAGINTVRVPISWSYLALGGANNYTLNMQYWTNFVAPMLETLTSSGIYAILDLHTYMHYSWMGTQISGCANGTTQCPDGTLDTDANDYLGIWSSIYQAITADKNINQNYLMLDLVNEPAAASGETLTPTQVLAAQAPTIKYLQANNFSGKILVEGDGWTGLHSWTTTVYADGQTNASVFSATNLKNNGINTENLLINVHQYFDSDFSGTQNTCQTDLTTTGANGFNLDAFAAYLKSNNLNAIVTEFGVANSTYGGEATCNAPLQTFLNYLVANASTSTSGGFVGATMWGTGHGWGGASGYNLYFDATSYQFTTMMQALID